MTSHDNIEAFDRILDYRDSLGRDFTAEELAIAAEAQAQITAYTGRTYSDIRHDVARCAVDNLKGLQTEEVDNVTPMRQSRVDVYESTRYVATTTKIES